MEPNITLEQAKAIVATKVAPKVTEESIKAKIDSVAYKTHYHTTMCIIEMRNGFRVIGHSTPASIENFDAEVGQRYAYDNAFKQLWQFEGYLLRELLSA